MFLRAPGKGKFLLADDFTEEARKCGVRCQQTPALSAKEKSVQLGFLLRVSK